MKTLTVQVLAFDEMTEAQQKQAIEVLRTIEIESSGNEFMSGIDDNHKDDLKPFGIEDVKIEWSGFGCQGNGASFSTDSVDIEMFMRKKKIWSLYRPLHNLIKEKDITFKVTRNSNHYCHEYTVAGDAEHYIDPTPKQGAQIDLLVEVLTDFIRERSREFYRDVESSYNHSVSDEGIKELIEANEYEFQTDVNGNIEKLA